MPDQSGTPKTSAGAMAETTAFLLGIFADFFRQEIAAEEDVHRTLPFFGTALGIVIGALAYAAGRLPRWPDLTGEHGKVAFVAASVLLGLAVAEAACVLFWLARAVARRNYGRVGPEPALRARLAEIQSSSDSETTSIPMADTAGLDRLRATLLDAYTSVTPANRELNHRRVAFRAAAASHLIRSLIWAVGAACVIFAADKIGYLPKAMP